MPISPPARIVRPSVFAVAASFMPTLIAWRTSSVESAGSVARFALGFRPVWTTSRCVVLAFTPASTQIRSAPVSRASVETAPPPDRKVASICAVTSGG